jgi:hypothetical protein
VRFVECSIDHEISIILEGEGMSEGLKSVCDIETRVYSFLLLRRQTEEMGRENENAPLHRDQLSLFPFARQAQYTLVCDGGSRELYETQERDSGKSASIAGFAAHTG